VIEVEEGSGGNDSFSKGFAANLVRDDFLVIEVALNIKAGLDEGLFTRPDLKEMFGLSDEQISQYASYVKNCPELIQMIREEGLKKDGKASLFGHAVLRHLTRLRDPEFKEDQLAIARKVIEEELGSEAVGALVDAVLSKGLPSSKSGNRKPASRPLPIPSLPTGVKGRIKQGQMRLEFRWETQEDLQAAIAQVTELLQQPGFIVSLLPPPKPDCSTPGFKDHGKNGGLGLEVPCLAGTVGSTEGKEVNK
jgi:ParB-like chromosome segregation protein Spo0J